MLSYRTTARVLLILLFSWALAGSANAGDVAEQLVFPVVGDVTYEDDFGDPRGQGRHEGNDIVAERGTPVVAVESGKVSLWTTSWRAGCMLYLHGGSGTTYLYVHLNNDRTDGNDNGGGCVQGIAYASGLADGQRVRAGQLLGYVGDSGDADGIHPHLHFELHPGGGEAISPFSWLERAAHLLFAAPGPARAVADGSELRLALYGTVDSADGERLTIRLDRLRSSTGWRSRTIRELVVTVPTEASVERMTGRGRKQVALTDLVPGEKAVVWTAAVEPTLEAQLGEPGVLVAARVLFRGDA